MTLAKPKILYVVAEDWFFCSHFIDRAVAARTAGYDVAVLTRVGEHGNIIRAAGLRLLPLQIDRRSLSPLSMSGTLTSMVKAYWRERPALVHHVALKPVLLGTLAARITRVPRTINAVVGMGYVFTSTDRLARLLRPLLDLAFRLLLDPPGGRVVFENDDDLQAMVRSRRIRPDSAVLIRGAGVDPDRFRPSVRHHSIPLVVLPARMLWDKGIGEFVEAARRLKHAGVSARFALVGEADDRNRAAIDASTLDSWRREGVVELWGFRDDMAVVLAQSDVACLPSYREGLPKALLEAMSAGLPCVATDVPGCREAVRHEDNGLLVPAKDAQALAAALQRLIEDAALRLQMGKRGRERILNEFASSLVVRQTLELYAHMLEPAAAEPRQIPS